MGGDSRIEYEGVTYHILQSGNNETKYLKI